MIPRLKPYLRLKDLRYLFKQRNSIYDDFERQFAELTRSKYAIILPNGRSALYLFLGAQDIHNREIIVPAYMCRTMLGPILDTKNIPIFVDSKDNDFNMDECEVEEKITANTKVIMPAAMYGYPIRMDYYRKVKNSRKDIYLIGDYALGLFTFLTKQNSEALETFDMIFFSFGLGKEITFLGGGVVITNSKELHAKLKQFRDDKCRMPDTKILVKTLARFLGLSFFFTPLLYGFFYLLSEKTKLFDKEKNQISGINGNLTDDFLYMPTKFQIGLALDRLKCVQSYIAKRQHAINVYSHELNDLAKCHLRQIKLPDYCDTLSHFPVLVSYSERDRLLRHLVNKGIHTAVIYKKTLDSFYTCRSKEDNDFPNARSYTECVLTLPLYYSVSNKTIRKVVTALREWQTEER